jgi:hypothetical protein
VLVRNGGRRRGDKPDYEDAESILQASAWDILRARYGFSEPILMGEEGGVPGGSVVVQALARPVRGWQPHRHLRVDCLYNVGSSISHNPIGLHGLLRG